MAKYYIFFTDNIRPIGGLQIYTLGKAEYLEKQGWNVVVINPTHTTGVCGFSGLNKYLKYGVVSLYYIPSELPKIVREAVINRLIKSCNFEKEPSQIYVESQYLKGSLWAELFAKKVNAKHIIFDCSENFRGNNYYYEDIIEFYKYKLMRNELFGISKDSIRRLFEGYDVTISDNQKLYFNAVEPGAVKDVQNDKVNQLERLDYNILYIGRGEKGYVPNIIRDVAKFSKNHSDKTVSFVVIGGMETRKQELEILENCSNVKVNLLGTMVPIPRSVFQYIDVVIAGAGCAELAVYEGVKTIVVDAKTYHAVGVFGYDTMSYFFAEDDVQEYGCDYFLEKVLIKKEYDRIACNLPERFNLQREIASQLSFFDNSNKLEYYDVMSCKINREISKRMRIRCILSDIKSSFLRRKRQ